MDAAATHGRIFDVEEHGAVGDGTTLNTAALNRAIEACARAGGGEVFFPPGRYVSGTLRLQSHVTLVLSPAARLIGTTNLSEYSRPATPDFMPEARWGKWHRGLIIADGADDIAITGPGTIDGNKVFDPTGEEHMRGPHTIVLANCRGFTLRDVTILDSANYAVFFQVTDDVDIRNVTVIGGWDGIHWRGAPERWCHHVNIVGCRFYTGDDSIAGRYWDQTVIADCIINSSCNGVRVIGPATGLTIHDCLFYGPGLQPHRTSGENRRTNMLSGIILQPGAWDATRGPLDQVLISHATMQNVASPLTIWTRPGNAVGSITVVDLSATGVYRSALSVEGWGDIPINQVSFSNVRVSFNGAGTAEQGRQAVKGPGVDARILPAWGLYARNTRRLILEDMRLNVLEQDFRPVIVAEGVQELRLDNVTFPQTVGVEAVVATNSTVIRR